MAKRTAKLKRETKETKIAVEITVDGAGRSSVATGMPFMDHMITLLARHSLMNLVLKAKGDLEVDFHHTVEDVGLTLGTALDNALGSRSGICRYGCATVPMDDALSRVVVDMGGRPYLVYETANRRRKTGNFDLGLIREFMQAFSAAARMNLHVAQLYGREPHHAYESMFKALAVALKTACALDPRVKGVPSSKGKL
jgi:imidazoleglycerol-phosphate dehydratase